MEGSWTKVAVNFCTRLNWHSTVLVTTATNWYCYLPVECFEFVDGASGL